MILVGMVFKGYCGGAFGRDGFGPKRVEAFGADWIVVRNEKGEPLTATFENTAEMLADVEVFAQEKSGWET